MRVDPDALSDDLWEAITDYVSDQATPAAAATMRERITTDPAIASTVAPLQALWHLLEPARAATRALPPLPSASDATEQETMRTVVAWARLESALIASTATPPPSPPMAEASLAPCQLRSIAPRAPRSAIPPVRTPSWWRRPWVVTTSIACLLLLSAGIVFRVAYPALRYQGGFTGRVVTLPDSSVATLSPGAYLGTSHSYTYGTRDVYLFGQAHFQVAPDSKHPFIVHVVGVDATALGTTFAMTSDTLPRVAVQVTQGKIALMILGKDGTRRPALVLTAGQVQQIPALTQWLTEAGAVLGAAGVPFHTAVQVHNTMMRAAAALAAQHP
ncbi:MAG TPA: FecR domain-containing protein [Gemmatimonadaceae bacterium]|jgi:ferric-dicitrate binding protein FerR (iron transport regulator)|nr:FecR domain-containing protein [Gemmatimonadaceae bacterium]